MEAVVLAGGFAKRMWPLTKNKPKHLLDVGGKPMLNYVLEKLEKCPDISKVYISTNAKFEKKFDRFLDRYMKNSRLEVELIIEDAKKENEKLGSVGALAMLVKEKNINGDLMVIGADNIFSFEIRQMLSYFRAKGASVLAAYDVKGLDLAKKYGILSVDGGNMVIGFEEKPEHPESTLSSTCFFIFTREDVARIQQYLGDKNSPDAMGHFIGWLQKNSVVYAYLFSGYWFDIGSFGELDRANSFFRRE